MQLRKKLFGGWEYLLPQLSPHGCSALSSIQPLGEGTQSHWPYLMLCILLGWRGSTKVSQYRTTESCNKGKSTRQGLPHPMPVVSTVVFHKHQLLVCIETLQQVYSSEHPRVLAHNAAARGTCCNLPGSSLAWALGALLCKLQPVAAERHTLICTSELEVNPDPSQGPPPH